MVQAQAQAVVQGAAQAEVQAGLGAAARARQPFGQGTRKSSPECQPLWIGKAKLSCECNTWLLSHGGANTMATCTTARNWEAKKAANEFHTGQGKKNDTTASWCINNPVPPVPRHSRGNTERVFQF